MDLLIRPSGTERALACPGSLKLCSLFTETSDSGSSIYAAEGTVAHKIGELCLKNGKSAEAYLGTKHTSDGHKFTVSYDMIQAVQVYLDLVRSSLGSGVLHTELFCSLNKLNTPGLKGGTTDALIHDEENSTIKVIDYKHGAGKYVTPQDNSQLMQYGLGACISLGIDRGCGWDVELTIVQPRHTMYDEHDGYQTWKTTSDYLWSWFDDTLVELSEKVHDPEAHIKYLNPGEDACQWCPATAVCPARGNQLQSMAQDEFKEASIQLLTPEQLANIVIQTPSVISFLKSVGEYVLEHTPPQLKLVRKKTNRAYTDEALLDLSLYIDERELTNTKLKGIGEVTKLFKSKGLPAKEVTTIINSVTVKPEGKLVAVPLADKREAVDTFKHLAT